MSLSEPIFLDPEDDIEDIGFRFAAILGGVMKDTEEDTDETLELRGTSPFVINLVMVLVTVFLPIGGVNLIYNFAQMPPMIYSALWLWHPGRDFWYLFKPWEFLTTIWITVPLCTFNFLFVREINRFFSNTASRDIVLFYGILSMIAPSAISLSLWNAQILPHIIMPIPIQFIVGVYLLYKFRDPDYISPWDGYFIDWSWWERQKYAIDDPNAKVINLTKLLMQHDADWLEGYDEEE